MRDSTTKSPSRIHPTLRWGVAIGIAVIAADAISLVLARGYPPESDAVRYIESADLFANLVLFAVAGLRVGRETGVVRSAAEAGVLAGTMAGAAAILMSFMMPEPAVPAMTTQHVIGTLAWNVAMGGVLANVFGWLANRSASRPAGR